MNEMDPLLVVALVLLSIVVFPVFWCLIVLLISFVGGWQRLSKVYAANVPPHGQEFSWQTGRVGLASYRNCLNVHVAPEGLFLSMPFIFRIGHKPLLIPWHEIHSPEAVRFLWVQAIGFQVGLPAMGRILLPRPVFEAAVGSGYKGIQG